MADKSTDQQQPGNRRTVKLPRDLTHEEAQALLTASFFLTANANPQPAGSEPLAAHTAQMLLAEALDEDLPEQALQDVQRQMSALTERAQQRARAQEQVQAQQKALRKPPGSRAEERQQRAG